MQKNDEIKLKIEDMGVDGEGIGKYDGMTFFVKDAVLGDTVKAKITKLKKNYGYARLEELVIPSEFRTEPRCALHRRCGGCQIQALEYTAQLRFKENKVRNHLMRLGGFSPEMIDRIMEPAVGLEEPYRYRNKAQFPIGKDKDGNPIAGFYAARTHSIIPVTDCLLGVEENRRVLEEVLSYMKENRVPAYDETTGKGTVRHVLIRYGFTTGEIMVCIVINGTKLPAQENLIGRLSRMKGMTSISVNVNTKNTNVILGDVTETIWGQAYITDYIHLYTCKGGVSEDRGSDWTAGGEQGTDAEFQKTDTAIAYHISPQSFYQVNPVQTEKLYSLALEYAGLTGRETVWDLYCGIGTISLFLAQRAGKVYGVEVVPQAVEDARNNAKRNGIANAEFFVGRAEEVLPEFYETESRRRQKDSTGEAADTEGEQGDGSRTDMLHPDVIVVDPPRKGCDVKCLETMVQMQPERIVYVSCDSATLARDLRFLCDNGYELRRGRVVDQFGNTVHVETVCLLGRRKPDDTIKVSVNMDDYYQIRDAEEAEKNPS